jgi:DNA-binding response OmpR family regulator
LAHILVGSQDDTLRGLLEVSLTRFDHFVRLAENGKDSIQLIQQDEFFDLALFDQEMPDMTAKDVLTRLKEIRRSVPLVMIMCMELSAETMKEGVAAGASDFVVKPFNLPDLVIRIEGLLKSKNLL